MNHIEYSVSKKIPNYFRNLDEFGIILYLNGFSISFDQNACRSFPQKKIISEKVDKVTI